MNIREHAGWSGEGRSAGAKMGRADRRRRAEPMPATPLVPLESHGVTLVLGRDAVALEAAARLQDRLDLTVLLTGAEEVTPPARRALPGDEGPCARRHGLARRLRGGRWTGARHAPPPPPRARYEWGPGKDGATSRADIVLDLTAGAPLFPRA